MTCDLIQLVLACHLSCCGVYMNKTNIYIYIYTWSIVSRVTMSLNCIWCTPCVHVVACHVSLHAWG